MSTLYRGLRTIGARRNTAALPPSLPPPSRRRIRGYAAREDREVVAVIEGGGTTEGGCGGGGGGGGDGAGGSTAGRVQNEWKLWLTDAQSPPRVMSGSAVTSRAPCGREVVPVPRRWKIGREVNSEGCSPKQRRQTFPSIDNPFATGLSIAAKLVRVQIEIVREGRYWVQRRAGVSTTVLPRATSRRGCRARLLARRAQ